MSRKDSHIFERFTDRSRRVTILAQEEARLLCHQHLGTEHLLLGLIHEGEGVGAKALEKLGVTIDKVRECLEPGSEEPTGHLPFNPKAKRILEFSLREALQLGHNYIGTEHLLLGLLRLEDSTALEVLEKLGVNPATIRAEVIDMLASYQGAVTEGDESPSDAKPYQLGFFVKVELEATSESDALACALAATKWPLSSLQLPVEVTGKIGDHEVTAHIVGVVPLTAKEKQ